MYPCTLAASFAELQRAGSTASEKLKVDEINQNVEHSQPNLKAWYHLVEVKKKPEAKKLSTELTRKHTCTFTVSHRPNCEAHQIQIHGK